MGCGRDYGRHAGSAKRQLPAFRQAGSAQGSATCGAAPVAGFAVGVALAGSNDGPLWSRIFGFVALIFAAINIFGGFLVTQRMLAMYKKKTK